MTTPNEELRKLAEAAIPAMVYEREYKNFEKSITPECVIALLDQLQSQAERIKELESEVEMWKATANAVVDFEKVQLRAEIAAIAATEPVSLATDQTDEFGEVIYREVFTRPMPAQGVKDAERYRWLREQHWSTDTIAVVLNPKQAVKLGYVCPSDSLLDETIDAAIAKGTK